MRYEMLETDSEGYVLEPRNPKFNAVMLYRGTTLGNVDFGDDIRVTGHKSIAQIWALFYSKNPRMRSRVNSDIVDFLAKEFGLDQNPDAPVVVTVRNAERYIHSLRDLNDALRSEHYMSLQGPRRHGDITLEQVTDQERQHLLRHLKDINLKCRMFIPDHW